MHPITIEKEEKTPGMGLEPMTTRLKAARSTNTELTRYFLLAGLLQTRLLNPRGSQCPNQLVGMDCSFVLPSANNKATVKRCLGGGCTVRSCLNLQIYKVLFIIIYTSAERKILFFSVFRELTAKKQSL